MMTDLQLGDQQKIPHATTNLMTDRCYIKEPAEDKIFHMAREISDRRDQTNSFYLMDLENIRD